MKSNHFWKRIYWLFRGEKKKEISPDGNFSYISFGDLSYSGMPIILGKPIEETEAQRKLVRPPKWLAWTLSIGLLVSTLFWEMRTSTVQAWLFSRYARQISYQIEPGPSDQIIFPQGGPYDQRHGYSSLPRYLKRLKQSGFSVTAQSRFSPQLHRIAAWGVTPPFREAPAPRLTLLSMDGTVMFDAASDKHLFNDYNQIPSLLAKALLFVENRDMDEIPPHASSNPVVEWDRLAKATVSFVGIKVGLPLHPVGGSTLATQLEKYRHSPAGRTDSAGEKFRQMLAASLKVYRSGNDALLARREIVTDYLNTMPMAATPGVGEINGIGLGLEAYFGEDVHQVAALLNSPGNTEEKARAFRQVLTLICAVQAPSYYLQKNQPALEARVERFLRLMAEAGLITPALGRLAAAAHAPIAIRGVDDPAPFSAQRKTTNALRLELSQLLGQPNFYDLDQLHLEAKSTIDLPLQRQVIRLFEQLKDPSFLQTHGFYQEHLLPQGDPEKVVYSLMLLEKTPQANLLRVQTDTLAAPLDVNEGIKMELGSTAKLRTLAHYLELLAQLYVDQASIYSKASQPRDPITLWVAETLKENPHLTLEQLFDKALDQKYSASPAEAFFTGGGIHFFHNFDPEDDKKFVSIRESVRRSVNLVFIRLMRDIVRFHQVRLGYDEKAIFQDPDNPARQRLLNEAAENESRRDLYPAWQNFRTLPQEDVEKRLLGNQTITPRSWVILFFGLQSSSGQEAPATELGSWLQGRGIVMDPKELQRLSREYGKLALADYAYLLHVQPLTLWCAAQLKIDPQISWSDLWGRSQSARQSGMAWLFRPRSRRAQDLRLRIRIEEEAFARMTPSWKQLGFPFERLVPSYATAIGSSSDRPDALAELIGIILNDGALKPALRLESLRFARNTPYDTVLAPKENPAKPVMRPAVAKALKSVLAEVVTGGTARRLAGSFKEQDGTPIIAGGKTGSGDNRFKTFAPNGGVLTSRAVNRTAVFVFYIGDRYFGVITASVLGREAEDFSFTSSLPVAVLKLMAPQLNARLRHTNAAMVELRGKTSQPNT
jgi:membrane peptidoglycan carboxypeptidase